MRFHFRLSPCKFDSWLLSCLQVWPASTLQDRRRLLEQEAQLGSRKLNFRPEAELWELEA